MGDEEDPVGVDTSAERRMGGSLSRRPAGPIVQPNAAKTIHEIVQQQSRMRNDSGKKTTTHSKNQSEKLDESAEPEEVPGKLDPQPSLLMDSNIYRQSEQMLTTYYQNLPKGVAGVFNLSDKELKIIKKLKTGRE